MAKKKQPIYRDLDLNENGLFRVSKMELTQDALNSTGAVRKSQAETIANNTVQSAIVNNLSSPDATTTLDTQQLVAQLATKQNVISVDASSTNYFEIVDGTKLKIKDLSLVTFEEFSGYSGLTAFIAGATFNGDGTVTIGGVTIDKNTFVVLKDSVNQSDRSYIYKGTNTGDATDFVNAGVDINVSTVRNMLSVTGTGVNYDSNTGVCNLVFGSGASDLGGQTVPHGATFTTIAPDSTIKGALEKLEILINSVDQSGADGTAAVTNRLNNLTGVTGANYGAFTQGLFSDNKNNKQLLQESEILHKTAVNDRAAIRSEFASADSSLQANINTEASSRASADTTLQTNINNEATARVQADSNLHNNLTNEAITRSSADNALCSRLDVIEGSGAGSISKAEVDAKAYADAVVLVEKNRAESAEAGLHTKIDNLAEGDVQFVGSIGASGIVSIRQARIDAGDNRNGEDVTTITLSAGEVFVVGVDQTIGFSDSDAVVQVGDKLMAIEDGASTKAKFNIVQADGSAITVANIGSSTIEKDGSDKLAIVADSVGRTQLDSAIEADIDDKQSLTSANTITSDGDTHFVISTETGAQQNVYFKRNQTSSSALSGTARTLLGELHVSSDGSGNATAPSYAHTTTMATHYNGDCVDLSMVIAGGNFEANGSATSATQATGVYGTAIKPQLGISVGGTFVAGGAGISNLGAFGYASTDGSGSDRGLYGAVANMDVVTFSGTRTVDPVPYNDVAIVADAKYAPAGSKALYAYGDVVLEGGNVTVPSASADTDAVNLGDVKGKQKIYQFDLVDGVEKLITTSGVDLTKSIYQVVQDNLNIEVSVERDVTNSQLKVTASGGSLTGVRLLLQELSCGVTTVA